MTEPFGVAPIREGNAGSSCLHFLSEGAGERREGVRCLLSHFRFRFPKAGGGRNQSPS